MKPAWVASGFPLDSAALTMNKPVISKPFRREHLQYWYGDIARTRATAEILSDPRPALKLFVYGAGTGGDWPRIMRDQESRITFLAYEAEPKAFAILKKRFNGIKAELLTGNMTKGMSIDADYVVSFNVIGHSANPEGYLKRAARMLAKTGVLYVQIDDSECRPTLDLDTFRDWRSTLSSFAARHLGALHRMTGLGPTPVERVHSVDLDEFFESAGLTVAEARHEKLQSFEAIAKTLPKDAQEGFVLFWLAVEDQLNQRFKAEAGEIHGETVNLARAMVVRTFKLQQVYGTIAKGAA